MGQKELLRGKVMELVKRGQLTIRSAAKDLKVSYRQGRRIYAAYRAEGDKGIIHGNAGKPSNRKTAVAIREQAVRAYRQRYGDFGPTFAAGTLSRKCAGERHNQQCNRFAIAFAFRRYVF
ncbi:MAG: helix-turn-helix domain-containing protein [Spirochaetales bacterium]|jgi:transposase|nr:helix-turn-helix domain-containing protein [Spirochaetales bacterium]